MTKTEIDLINKLAKGASIATAVLQFFGLESKTGSEAAVNGAVEEVEQWNAASAAVRSGIEAYKNAKAAVTPKRDRKKSGKK